MLERYLILREKYDPNEFSDENMDFLLNKIKSLSSKRMFSDYEDFINPETNFESPILMYKNKFERYIVVTNFTLTSDSYSGDGAEITFDAMLKNKVTKQVETSSYKAVMNYIISDLSLVSQKKAPFCFAVTDYKTYKLSK